MSYEQRPIAPKRNDGELTLGLGIELTEEELDRVSACDTKMTIKFAPEYTKWSAKAGSSVGS